MGELVIGDGEGFAHAEVEGLEPQLFAHAHEPPLAQYPVEVNGPRDVIDAVLRD